MGDKACVTEADRLDFPGRQLGEVPEEHAQAEGLLGQAATRVEGRREAPRKAQGVSAEAEVQLTENESSASSQQQRAWRAATAVGGTLIALASLWIARRLSQRGTRQNAPAEVMAARGAYDTAASRRALNQESAYAPDVVLTGLDQQGGDISLSIPGRSIAGPSGSVVGRNPFEGAFVLNQKEISRRHFRLFAVDGQLMVEDLESMNGTQLDGTRLAAGGWGAVRNGSELGVGRLKLTVRLQSRAGQPVEGKE